MLQVAGLLTAGYCLWILYLCYKNDEELDDG